MNATMEITDVFEAEDIELVPKTDARSGIVSINPARMGGISCFSGSRVPISHLWEYLENDGTLDEFLDGYPSVSRAQCLQLLALEEVQAGRLTDKQSDTQKG